MTARLAILISGRGSNMRAIVEACQTGVLRGVAEPVVVVANRPDAAGVETARSLGVRAEVVPSKGRPREEFERDLLSLLEPLDPDFVVLAGFLRVLTPLFVRRFAGRIVNIHPADTKAYQGAHGYEWAFERRLEATRITVHLVDEGVDTGTVLAQAEVDLRGAATLDEVQRRGLAVEHRLYPETIRALCMRRAQA